MACQPFQENQPPENHNGMFDTLEECEQGCGSPDSETYCCIQGESIPEGPWTGLFAMPCGGSGDPPIPTLPSQECLDSGKSFYDCCIEAGCDGGGGPVPFCIEYMTPCQRCTSPWISGGANNKCVTASSMEEAIDKCSQ